MKNIKLDLRNKYKLIRAQLHNKELLSEKICDSFIESELYKNAPMILAYSSVNGEVSCEKIIERALSDKKQVALPKCLDAFGTMRFYLIESIDDTETGLFGIREPVASRALDRMPDGAVCLVPGLSFSLTAHRLGYGKGYYDRFLKDFNSVRVGLCYDQCLCGRLPFDSFDEKVNYLITDKRIYNFNIKED